MGWFTSKVKQITKPTITITNRTEEERIRKEKEKARQDKICSKIKELFKLETVCGGPDYSGEVYASSLIYGDKPYSFGPTVGEQYVHIQAWRYPNPTVIVYGQTKEVAEEFVKWLAEFEGWKAVELDIAPRDKFDEEEYIAYPENKSV